MLIASITASGNTYVKGTLNSLANTVFTVQVFANNTADPSGYGEGEVFLGQATVTTDGAGSAIFQVSSSMAVPAGEFVSATATDSSNNTSEFAADISVVKSSKSVYANDDQYDSDFNSTLVIAAPGVQANDIAANGKAFSSALVTGPANGMVTLNADSTSTILRIRISSASTASPTRMSRARQSRM